MKLNRIISLVVALIVTSIASQAQQFTVALKNGEKHTFTNAEVDSIFFHEPVADPEPPYVAPKSATSITATAAGRRPSTNRKRPSDWCFV